MDSPLEALQADRDDSGGRVTLSNMEEARLAGSWLGDCDCVVRSSLVSELEQGLCDEISVLACLPDCRPREDLEWSWNTIAGEFHRWKALTVDALKSYPARAEARPSRFPM